jgi:hypothetical protein
MSDHLDVPVKLNEKLKEFAEENERIRIELYYRDKQA